MNPSFGFDFADIDNKKELSAMRAPELSRHPRQSHQSHVNRSDHQRLARNVRSVAE